MARIVNLTALIPEDITFVMPGGAEYVAPGDAPVALILRIQDLFAKAQEDAAASENGHEVGVALLRELDNTVVELLRMRDPEIESSPFGLAGIMLFVAELVAAYNAQAGEDPTKPSSKTGRSTSSGSRSTKKR